MIIIISENIQTVFNYQHNVILDLRCLGNNYITQDLPSNQSSILFDETSIFSGERPKRIKDIKTRIAVSIV